MDDVSYQVMPRLNNKSGHDSDSEQAPLAEIKRVEQKKEDNLGVSQVESHKSVGFFQKKWVRISLVAIVVLALIAGGAYWFMNRAPKEIPPTVSTRLPKVWLAQYFGSEFCEEQETCGDEADPDLDGLDNVNEFKQGTSPKSPDTDEDGLADGDEVNIYKTDPVLKYTDRRVIAAQNDYNDGVGILNEYDPLTSGIKLTQIRKNQIVSAINEFGLHEPTVTTLGLNDEVLSGNQLSTISVFIEANEFLPEVSFINLGDTIVWVNKDVEQHKVKFISTDLPSFESPVLGQDQTFNFTFKTAGTYDYIDEFNSQITGTIQVQ
jgi:plastocyanin